MLLALSSARDGAASQQQSRRHVQADVMHRSDVPAASWQQILKLRHKCAGDDDGRIQLWDLRQAAAVGSFAEHTDYISDMAAHAPERALLACSGDGTLSVNDLRTFKVAKP